MIRTAARWIVAAVVTFVASPLAFGQSLPPYAPDRVIIKFKDPKAVNPPSRMPPGASVTLDRRFRGGAQLLRIRGMSVEDALTHFASDPRVEYVEPDYIITLDQSAQNLPNDPQFDDLYGLSNTGQTQGAPDADIDAPEAWAIQTGGDVLIGVIDTGIDWRHEDIAANVWTNPGEIPDNGIDDDNNGFIDDIHGWDFINGDNDPMDDHRHGTHVSGTIAAVGNNGVGVVGVCWRAQLIAIKILNGNGSGTISSAVAGIEYAALMGARLTNNSWGGAPYSRALDEALAALEGTNTLFIAAAGNAGSDTDFFPHYPASHSYDHVISVANTDHNDELAFSSNYGAASVDLSAPGSLILSLVPNDKYGLLSGTSMAAPHVSGAIGLILAEAPLMTSAQVKALLIATADAIPAMQGKAVAGGRLNVYNALSALDATAPGMVTGLRVVETGSNTVTLTWTASGDDADAGKATEYDIRYSSSRIKPEAFEEATRVENVLRPGASGAQETFRVGGLAVKTTYFFAMRVLDERVNVSGLSKVVIGRTKGAPKVEVTPLTLDGAALSGAAVTRTIRITNTGRGTVDFVFAPSAAGWTVANPTSGSARARETIEVVLTMNALGLAGGEHDDTVVLTTNDPAMPSVIVPAHLMVTSAPHLVVSQASIDFGEWLVGAGNRREIRVMNQGDQVLAVAAIVVDAPTTGFNVNVEPFSLLPGKTRVIDIDFSPATAQDIFTRLRIVSDDPDEPEVFVALAGRGLPPPDISVSPTQFSAQLITGATSGHTMTIVNEGTGDLNWELSISDNTDTPDPRAPTDSDRPFRDLTGIRILYDAAHFNLHWFNYHIVFADLKARGAEIDVNKAGFTPEFLEGFDVVWMAESFLPIEREEREALVAWVRAGGGLLLEGDYERTVPTFNGILQSLLAGIEISFENGTTGITNNIETHDITRDVNNVFLSRVTSTLSTVRPPARTLIYDIDGARNTAWSRSGAGRILVMADQNLANHRIGGTGNKILGNRIIDWLALGVPWLGATPSGGVLAPGESQIIRVRVDAMGLGGLFDARFVVHSNDPVVPTVLLPVHLDAIPAPDLIASDMTVRFPTTAVGRSSQIEMTVGNVGALALTVTDVSSSMPGFFAKPTAFALPPGGVETLTVTYAPEFSGKQEASLYIHSDDPDLSVLPVTLSGDAFTGIPRSARIIVPVGLSLRSWNIDIAEDAPEIVLAGVMSSLGQAVGYEDGTGLVFDPTYPDELITLERIDHLRAYWYDMRAPGSIDVDGFVVDPQTPIPLIKGWNTISYLPTSSSTVEHALQSVMDNVERVVGYEGEGLTFSPVIPTQLNSLRTLKPTYGYWVRMAAVDTLVYPDSVAAMVSLKHDSGPNIVSSARSAHPSREWIGLWGSGVVIDGRAIAPGTIISVQDRDGVVCGVGVVQVPGEFGLIAIYADDPATNVDEGAESGEQLTISIGDRAFSGVRWTEMGDVFEFDDVAVMSVTTTTRPVQTMLYQNYPNPFNPSTTISFDVREAAAVSLIIFNTRGQLVRTLVDGTRPSGRHTVTWGGTNDAGIAVATGVYFYRIVAGEIVDTRKMVLLK